MAPLTSWTSLNYWARGGRAHNALLARICRRESMRVRPPSSPSRSAATLEGAECQRIWGGYPHDEQSCVELGKLADGIQKTRRYVWNAAK
jgi:hypothetical protein